MERVAFIRNGPTDSSRAGFFLINSAMRSTSHVPVHRLSVGEAAARINTISAAVSFFFQEVLL